MIYLHFLQHIVLIYVRQLSHFSFVLALV